MTGFAKDATLELPDRVPIPIRSEPDRYGFSHLLARRFGLKKPPRSFARWQHGWVWWTPETVVELMYGGCPTSVPSVVASEKEKAALDRHGFKHVRIGGLPFAYTSPSGLRRRAGSCLALLPHSLDYLKADSVSAHYLDFLESIRDDFAELFVCVYAPDARDENLVRELKRRGLSLVIGAQPDDANSLTRMRWMFEQCEYVTSPGIGSHLPYAAFCGCKVSMSGPYAGPSAEYLWSDPYSQRHPESVDRLLTVFDREFIRAALPWLFVEHPRHASLAEEWGAEEIGANRLLSASEIKDALGWNPRGVLRAGIRACSWRIERQLARLV